MATFEVGQASSTIPRSASSADQLRVLDRAHAVRHPRDRQRQRLAHRLGAGVLAGVDRAAEPGRRRDLVGAGELRGRVAGLVARQVEADDVGVAVLGACGGRSLRRLDAEVADRDEQDARLDAGVGAGVVDALGDARLVLGVGQPDRRRVVGRGDHST